MNYVEVLSENCKIAYLDQSAWHHRYHGTLHTYNASWGCSHLPQSQAPLTYSMELMSRYVSFQLFGTKCLVALRCYFGKTGVEHVTYCYPLSGVVCSNLRRMGKWFNYLVVLFLALWQTTATVVMLATHSLGIWAGECVGMGLEVMHRLQLSRNLWDSPGFLEFVPDPGMLRKLSRKSA